MKRPLLATVLSASMLLGCPGGEGGVGGVLVVASVEVSPSIVEVTLGNTQQLTATPKTSSGIAVQGRSVSWSTTDATIATVSNSGLVTAQGIGGPVRIRGTVDGITGDAVITVRPVPVDHVTVEPPTANVLVQGQVLLTAKAFDANNALLAGRSFLWESSDHSIATVTTTGLALGVKEGGPVTISATAEGKTGTASVSVSTRPATRLAFAQQPGLGIAGQAMTPPVRVALQDDLLTTVIGAPNPVTIALAGNPGGATLSGQLTVTPSSGIATFSNLVLNRVGTSYSFQVTSPGLISAISSPFDVIAGSANQLAFTTAPSSTAQSGIAFGPQPALQLKDGSGNNVAQANVPITATIASGLAGATLTGTTTVNTNSFGLASFGDLALRGPVGGYTLSFGAPGVTPISSGTIALSPGPAAALFLATAPSSSAQSSTPLAQQPAIQLRDAAGNNVTQAGVTVTAAIGSGPSGSAVGGTAFATTNSSGLAQFAGLSLSGPPGSYTLLFTAATLTSVSSGTITLGTGAATQLAVITQPSSSAQSGTPFAQQPRVELRDAGNNPVAQAGVNITVAINSGAGTLGGTLTVATNASGQASFTNLVITGTAGDRTLIFTSGTLSAAVSGIITVSAGAASRLSITTQPSASAQSGVAFAQQPVIQLRDASNNPVALAGVNVTAAISTGGGSLGGTATVATNGSGVASFGNLQITGTVGNRTLIFTATGYQSVTSATIAITAGAPSQLTYTQQPSTTAQSGVAFAQQPILLLRDASNNPIAGVVVTATITGAPAGVSRIGTITATTSAAGLATFTNLGLSGTAGSYTLTFTTSSVNSAPSNSIALSAGTATQLTYNTQPSTTATSGQPFATQPVLLLRDASNNPVSGTTVTATITGSPAGVAFVGTTTATTNASGLASFSGLGLSGPAGNYTLTFSAGAVTSAPSNSIALSAGSGSQLTYTQQPSSSATSGQALAQQPILLLRDASNNPVPGASVTATITGAPAGASLIGTVTVTTNGSGIASFVGSGLGLSGPVGNYTLTFTGGSATSVASNTISLSAGAPTQLTFSTQPPASASSGQAFGTAPVLLLRDAANNPVGGTLVTATITGSPAGVSFVGSTTATTNGSGLATFSGLGLSGPAGNYTLTFTAGAVISAPSNSIALSAGGGTQLSYNTQPSAAANSGQAFAQQPVLLLLDASSNPVSGATVTASITGSPAGASLVGSATAVTNGSGLASFTTLGLSGPVGSYSLTFTSGAATSPASNSISLSAGTPTQLSYNTQPSTTAVSGAPFGTQPVLLLRDGANNPVGSVTVTATITGSPAGVSFVGTTTATTDASGLASFSGLGLSGPAGNYTLTFTGGSVTSAASNTIALSAGGGTQLTYNQQPSSSAQSGVAFAQQPILLLRDASNNPVNGVAVAATITGSPPGASLAGTATATTNASGLATFSDLGLSGPVGNYTLTFTTGTATSVASNTIALSTGPAAQLSYNQQPSTTATNGQAFGTQPVLLLEDSGGNPVGSTVVTATITGSPAGVSFVGTPTATTNGSGVATFTDLGLSGTAGNYTLTFISGAATSPASNSIALSGGAPSQLSYNTQPSSTASSGQAFGTQPVLLLQDASNNPVASVTVTATITGSPAGVSFVGTATATTNASGLASFTDLGLSGTAGTYTLTFTAGAVTSPASNNIVLGAGAPSQLSYNTQPPGTATSGVAFSTAPVLLLQDAANNPVPSTVVTATITGSPVGVSFVGTPTATTNGSGLATFSGLGLSGPIGNYTLTFTAGAATSPASNNIALGAGPAAQLSYNQQPSTTATNGQAFGTQPVLLLEDSGGNPVGSTVVTATITGSPAGVSFVGTTTATTNGSGVATFTDLGLSGTAGNYTLTFTSGAATSPASNTIALSGGAPSQLTYNTQPSNTASSGQAFGTQPVLLLQDASNNPVGSTVVTATITGSPAGVSFVGTATATTNASGLASFTDLGLSGTAGTYTLTFTAGAVTSPASNNIVLGAGAPSQLTYNTQPPATASFGVAFSTQPVLLLRDAQNNPVPSTLVSATITGSPAGVSFVGTPTATTDGSGVASFIGLGLSGPDGNYTLTFTAGAVTSAASNSIALSGAPTQLAINQQPVGGASGAALATQPIILVQDANGNTVTTDNTTQVMVTVSPGSGSLGGTQMVTAVNGVATFTNLTLAGTVGVNYVLQFTSSPALTAVTSNNITVTAGAASQMVITQQPGPPPPVIGGTLSTQPIIQVRDAQGNAVAGVSVTVSLESGPGSLSGTLIVISDASGNAVYTDLALSSGLGNHTLRFKATGVPDVVSDSF